MVYKTDTCMQFVTASVIPINYLLFQDIFALLNDFTQEPHRLHAENAFVINEDSILNQ